MRIRIVDWEYAGHGRPVLRPRQLRVNHDLTPDEDAELLAAYDGGPRPPRPPRPADADADGVRLPRGDVGRPPAGHQHARRRLRARTPASTSTGCSPGRRRRRFERALRWPPATDRARRLPGHAVRTVVPGYASAHGTGAGRREDRRRAARRREAARRAGGAGAAGRLPRSAGLLAVAFLGTLVVLLGLALGFRGLAASGGSAGATASDGVAGGLATRGEADRPQRRCRRSSRRRRSRRLRATPSSSAPATSRPAASTATRRRPGSSTASRAPCSRPATTPTTTGRPRTSPSATARRWGRHRTGRDRPPATTTGSRRTPQGYRDYFGPAALNDDGDTWYSYDLGDVARHRARRELRQGRWLRRGLATGPVAGRGPRRERRRLHARDLAPPPLQLRRRARQRPVGRSVLAGALRGRRRRRRERPRPRLRAVRAAGPERRRGPRARHPRVRRRDRRDGARAASMRPSRTASCGSP